MQHRAKSCTPKTKAVSSSMMVAEALLFYCCTARGVCGKDVCSLHSLVQLARYGRQWSHNIRGGEGIRGRGWFARFSKNDSDPTDAYGRSRAEQRDRNGTHDRTDQTRDAHCARGEYACCASAFRVSSPPPAAALVRPLERSAVARRGRETISRLSRRPCPILVRAVRCNVENEPFGGVRRLLRAPSPGRRKFDFFYSSFFFPLRFFFFLGVLIKI